MSEQLYYFIGTVSLASLCGIAYGYWKIFGPKKYKVVKDYDYKKSKIQVIINPQNNVCGVCYDILELNDEIARFKKCDHHFHNDCIKKQIDISKSDNPCPMCMK